MLKFDHINIRTAKLAETIKFYGVILDAHPGFRPPFPFPGAWLYRDGSAFIHLVEGITVKDDNKKTPSSNFHHIAFRGDDFEQFVAKVRAQNIPLVVAAPPETSLAQVFIQDPNGVTIEIVFEV